MTAHTITRRTFVLLNLSTGLVLVGLVLYRFSFLCLASDDSYIYAGYVKGIERGALFSYNKGEYSGGTTGLLYYYLLIISYLGMKPLLAWWTSIPTQLIGAVYLLNTVLWVGTSFLVMEICKERSRLLGYFTILLAAANSTYLWGVWGGLEGSLMSFLLVYLLYLVQHSPDIFSDVRFVLTLVGLTLGRPNWLPVCACLGLPCLYYGQTKVVLRNFLIGFTVFFALYSPLYFFTGKFLLSALGSRVTINVFQFNPRTMLENISILSKTIWFDLAIIILAAGIVSRSRMALWSSAVLWLDMCTRTIFGLTDLNIHDRYISFVWLTIAISLVDSFSRQRQAALWTAGITVVSLVFRQVFSLPYRTPHEQLGLLLIALASLVCVSFIFPIAKRLDLSKTTEVVTALTISIFLGASSYLVLRDDIQEMNEAHALPAIWMSGHIPQTARVSMEPAGALRVWNDFYLIDLVGLTTSHAAKYADGSVPTLINQEHPDYTFIYPKIFFNWSEYFTPVKCWNVKQRFSGGDICLYEIPKSVRE